ncbi:MAG: hypothetical protein CME59_08765 [Halioglobus sp.]|nr:hypothetical protein [Halioglobus sp.]
MIDMVYAATTQEGTVLQAVRKYLELQGDPGGAIFHYDSITDHVSDLEPVSFSDQAEALVEDVFDSYSKGRGAIHNPLISRGLEDLKAGKILVSDEVIPFDELSRTEYYKAVFEPLGVRWSMGWLAAGKGQKWLTFTSSRNLETGAYTGEHYARGQLFQRHMARVIHILELLEEASERKWVFERSVEKLPQAIVLLDDDRRVTFCNPAATSLMRRSTCLADKAGVFSVGQTSHERARFEQWWSLLTATVEVDGAAFNDVPMSPVWEIEVSRIGCASSQRGSGRRWMLTLKQCPDGDRLPLAYLQDRFGLSRAEAEVCANLCQNGDAVSTATAMALSPNTVRTHLKSAFKKTHTRNQVELVLKLVAK